MSSIKLGNIADWRILEGALEFIAPDYDRERPRKVRIDLNCEVGCNWYVAPAVEVGQYGEPRFLAAVPAGLSTLEFISDGDFKIGPGDAAGEVQYWTAAGETFWIEGDGETFSTIYERQPRNEALEYIMFQASQNQLRRDKAHAAELEAIRAEIGALSNGRETGIHGGPPAEHQEPRVEPQGKPDKRPGQKPVSGGAAPVPGDGQSGSVGNADGDTSAPKGEAAK